MMKSNLSFYFFILTIFTFAACKSQKQQAKISFDALTSNAATILGKQPIQDLNGNESLVLYQADFKPNKTALGNYCRFLIFDTSTGNEVYRSKQNVQTVKWYDNERIMIEIMPGTIMKGQTPERRYIWNIKSNSKETPQPSTEHQ